MIEFTFSYNLLSPTWWVAYLIDFAQREPAHLAIEIICGTIILYLIFSKPYKPNEKGDKLSKKEEDALIAEWQPIGLVPETFKSSVDKPILVVENSASAVAVINGEEHLNLASFNFAGLVGREEINKECSDVIIKYGVGSCGPRGFYGTIDQHIEIEKTAAKFMGTDDAILYSDSVACVSSVIPAFAKNTDVIVVDEYACFPIQLGCKLSRSTIIKYKHNDMEDLERILASIVAKDNQPGKKKAKLNRRFIITEGIFQSTGVIANFKKIVELKRKYKFRTIVDDSLAVGVLGATGRGSFEYHGFTSQDLDIICFSLDTTLGAVGGICVGSAQVVSHQRLSGAGYCFSAASPPYTARAATVALGLIDANPSLSAAIRTKARFFRSTISKVPGFRVVGGTDSDSPVVHLAFENSNIDINVARDAFEQIADNLRVNHFIVAHPMAYLPVETHTPSPAIRFNVNVLHADSDIETVARAFASASASIVAKIGAGVENGIESSLSKRA